MTTETTGSIRLSNKFSTATFVITPVFGLIIAYVIASKTLFAWWGILLAVAIAGYCLFFAANIATADLSGDTITLKKPLGPQRQVKLSDVIKMTKFLGRRHNYYFFKCPGHSFMLVAPIWGPGRQAIEDLYTKLKKD